MGAQNVIQYCDKTKRAFLMQFFAYLQENGLLLSCFFMAFKKNLRGPEVGQSEKTPKMKKNDFF